MLTPVLILGMRDNDCREALVEALEAVAGVTEAAVNLHRGEATVSHDERCGRAGLAAAVERAGYAVGE